MRRVYVIALLLVLVLSLPAGTSPEEKKLLIPFTYGKVVDHFRGTSDMLVIQIQDLHCHYEVQKNISRILTSVASSHPGQFVCLAEEGASGRVDTSLVSSIPDRAVRDDVTDFFMRRGFLTGAELFSIDTGMVLSGVEETSVYGRNLRVFQEALDSRPITLAVLRDLETHIDDLKKEIYSREMKDLEKTVSRYYSGSLALSEYVASLKELCSGKGIDFSGYENLAAAGRLMEMEKRIDLKQVQRETAALVSELRKVLSEEEKDRLSRLEEREEMVGEYYSYINQLINERKFDPSLYYPQLDLYLKYVTMSGINYIKLLKEEKMLLRKIQECQARTVKQKDLVFVSFFFDLIKDVLSYRITARDLDEYYEGRERFGALFTGMTEGTAGPSRMAEIREDISALEKDLLRMEEFYELAHARDSLMAENLIKDLSGKRTATALPITLAASDKDALPITLASRGPIGAVVAGGFHTAGMSAVLREKGISYITVFPSVTRAVDEERYFSIIKGIQTARADTGEIFADLVAPRSVFQRPEFTLKFILRACGKLITMLEEQGLAPEAIREEVEKFFIEWKEEYRKHTGEEASFLLNMMPARREGESDFFGMQASWQGTEETVYARYDRTREEDRLSTITGQEYQGIEVQEPEVVSRDVVIILEGKESGLLDRLVENRLVDMTSMGSVQWTGAASRVWIIGDVRDYGPQQKKDLSLIRHLQNQAFKARGRVMWLPGKRGVEGLVGIGEMDPVSMGQMKDMVVKGRMKVFDYDPATRTLFGPGGVLPEVLEQIAERAGRPVDALAGEDVDRVLNDSLTRAVVCRGLNLMLTKIVDYFAAQEEKGADQVSADGIIHKIAILSPDKMEELKKRLGVESIPDLRPVLSDIAMYSDKEIFDLNGEDILRFAALDPVLFQKGTAPEILRGQEGYVPSGALYTYREEMEWAQLHEGYYPLFRQVTSALSVKGVDLSRGGVFGIKETELSEMPVKAMPVRGVVEVKQTRASGIVVVSGAGDREKVYLIKPSAPLKEPTPAGIFWDQVLIGVRALGNVAMTFAARSPLMDPIASRFRFRETIEERGVEIPSLKNLRAIKSSA